MQKITSGLALFLLAAVCSFGQIVNPSGGGGGGDVFKAGSNIFTGTDNFTSATLILPNGTVDPTGTCPNAAAIFTNTTTGAQSNCIGGIWKKGTVDFSSLSGDITATSGGAATLQAIKGIPVSATVPTLNQFLSYNGTSWIPAAIPGLAGDVTGSLGANTVARIQGTQVSATTPTTNQVLSYNGTQWAPATPVVTTSVTMGGDVSGASNTSTVVGIRGVAVSSTSPLNGQVLTYNGSQYAPSTPASSVTMGGDVSGPSGSSTVVKIQGTTVSATTPTANQYLSLIGSVWTPTTLPNLAGDVVGAIGANLVSKIQGTSVASVVPTSGQVLAFDGSQWAPTAPTVDAGGNSSVAGTADTGTENSPYGFLGTGSNFISYSVQINGSGWSLNNGATATQNATTAPDGTNTGNLITSGTVAPNSVSTAFTTTSAGIYTFSVWAKTAGTSTVMIGFRSGFTILKTSSFTLSSTANGWQRIYVSSPSLTAATQYAVDIYPGGNTSIITANTIYAWGAQVNPGSGPTGFTKTYVNPSVTGVNGLVVGTGSLTVLGTTSGTSTIAVPAVAGDQTVVLPGAAPSVGQVLSAGTVSGGTTTTAWATMFPVSIKDISSAYTVLVTDYSLVFTGSSATTITLNFPTIAQWLNIKNAGTATVTLSGAVDGSSGRTIAAGSVLHLQFDSALPGWRSM